MEPVSDDLRYLVQDSPSLRIRRGLEQLDQNLNVVDDLSDYLVGGSVMRQNYADDGHLSADLRLSKALPWEAVRLRPYLTLTDGVRTERCDLGVLLPKRPKDNLRLYPPTYDLACQDLLVRLRREIEAPVRFEPGDYPLLQARVLVAQQGLGVGLFDGTAELKQLTYAMNFEIVENEPIPTYLRVVNELLASVGYRALWLDGRGVPRSGPYKAPAQRAPEWHFDVQAQNGIVDGGVEREVEALDAPNVWRFYQRGNENPSVGAGLYVVENQFDGPSSIDAIGRNASTRFFDAADQEALEAQGNRAVDSDRRRTTLYRVSTSPFTIAGHFDRYSFTDSRLGGSAEVLARSWRVDLGMGNTEHVWEAVT